ncbi:MAG: hypothetical protein IJ222_03370 [Bacteroidales bacterium]|nr:hypothetical protein [Bacteroidales bacterium]
MKRLVTILLILAGAVASAQEYPKYTVSKTLYAGALNLEVFKITMEEWIAKEGYFSPLCIGFYSREGDKVYQTDGAFDSKIRDIWWFLLGNGENFISFDCSFRYEDGRCIVTASNLYGCSGYICGEGETLIRECYPNNRTYNRDVKAVERFNEYFNEFCNSFYEYLCAAANS